MKKLVFYILIAGLAGTLGSCKKDNYDEPGSKLSGRLMYKGAPIEVEYDRVPFEIFEFGFGRVGPINGTFAPDGTYSHLLFNGSYKLIIRPGQGPFLFGTPGKIDSLSVTMNGSQELNIEVNPYYMIRNPQITGNATSLSAKLALEKIITDANAKNLERVDFYVNKTAFVSGSDNIGRTERQAATITDLANITLTVPVPAITPSQNYVFGRIGVKIAGVEDMLFSPVVKISF